jgi:hypothetical protein
VTGDPFGRCPDALEVHASLPPGRQFRLAAAVPDADENVDLATERSMRSHYRLAEQASKLGMTQAAYKAARAAGTLPAWCYARAPRARARQ